MNEVVKKVARAICVIQLRDIFCSEPSAEMIDEVWTHDIPTANAAISALLDAVSEPSEAIVADGWLAAHRIMTQDRCNHEMLRAAFRAMIAALRKEVEG